MISQETRRNLPAYLDKACAVAGALVPVGLVMGNVAFESMIAGVGIGWVIRSILSKDTAAFGIFKHPLVVSWLAWLVAIAVSLLVNGGGSKGWAHDIVFIRYLLYVAALLDISKRLPVGRYFLWGFAAGVVWAAVNTLSAYAMGFDLLGKPLIRYTGKLKEASRISGMSAYAAPFFMASGLFSTKLSKTTRTILVALGVAAFVQILQTHVRTAAIAGLAGILFALGVVIRDRVSLKAALGLAALFIIPVGIFFYVQDIYQLTTLYDRVYYWKVAFAMWRDHPLLGVGISSFQDVFKEVAASGKVLGYAAPDGVTYTITEQTHAHNLFFMLIASTGALGLAAFLWLFIRATKMVFQEIKPRPLGLVSWPVVFLTIGLTGFNIYHSWYQALLAFFMVLIGIGHKAYGDMSRIFGPRAQPLTK